MLNRRCINQVNLLIWMWKCPLTTVTSRLYTQKQTICPLLMRKSILFTVVRRHFCSKTVIVSITINFASILHLNTNSRCRIFPYSSKVVFNLHQLFQAEMAGQMLSMRWNTMGRMVLRKYIYSRIWMMDPSSCYNRLVITCVLNSSFSHVIVWH